MPADSEFDSSVTTADLLWDHGGEQRLVSTSTREQMTEDNGDNGDEHLYEDVHVDVEVSTAGERIYDLVQVEESANVGEIELAEYSQNASQADNGEEEETAV